MNNAVIDVEHLEKFYRDGDATVAVLRDVSLRVAPGEIVAILGSSGSGKSTLLHTIGGLDSVDGGRIAVTGVDLSTLNANARAALRNRALGFVYQFHHLLPEFSALDNVAMPLWIRRQDRGEATDKARAMLQAVGLEHRMTHLPSQLSGGERQRVAIARAVVTAPACVLADEPTGNLDKKTARQVFDLFIRLAREHQTAIVIVTHDEELARSCDRILRLNNGSLQED